MADYIGRAHLMVNQEERILTLRRDLTWEYDGPEKTLVPLAQMLFQQEQEAYSPASGVLGSATLQRLADRYEGTVEMAPSTAPPKARF